MLDPEFPGECDPAPIFSKLSPFYDTPLHFTIPLSIPILKERHINRSQLNRCHIQLIKPHKMVLSAYHEGWNRQERIAEEPTVKPTAAYVVDPSAQPHLLPVMKRNLDILRRTAVSGEHNTGSHDLLTSTRRYNIGIPKGFRDGTSRRFCKVIESQDALLRTRPLQCPECGQVCVGVQKLRDHTDEHVYEMYQQRKLSTPVKEPKVYSPYAETNNEKTFFGDDVSADMSELSSRYYTCSEEEFQRRECSLCPQTLPDLTELVRHRKRKYEAVESDECRPAPKRRHL